MDWFLNNSAYVYFVAMATACTIKGVAHFFQAWNLNTFRMLHTDEELRTLARDTHGGHFFGALSMIWFHWMILDYMVTFCATQPLEGAISHVPQIVFVWFVAYKSVMHLKRQRYMIAAHIV